MKGTLFALARNRNDIDANEKLKSMLYQVEATGAAFIDGKNILADSIFARHIQAGSITTEHMTAGSIKGDRIEVGTLNGDRITANTIKSNMIHTSGLDAGVIKTGTISAGNGVSVINMANGEFSLGGGKIGYVASTNKLYVGAGALFLGELPIEEHNRMVGSRQSAETQKTAITNEKQALDARYTSLYGNVSLTGTPKTDLATKYSNATTGYTTRYNSLVSALNAVIAAPTNTTIAAFATLQTAVTTATSNYTTALFALNTALELATKTIENAVAAKAQADATAAAALDAKTKADTAETNAKTYALNDAKSINFGYRYASNIVIYGDSDKYYPVVIKAGDQDVKRDILIKRGYSEQAPPDWNTATHKGGLTLKIKANFGGWGGANYSWEIHELEEMYSRMFAGAQNTGNQTMFAIFLRGGGTTGAIYHLYSDQSLTQNPSVYNMLDGTIPPSPQIALSQDLVFYCVQGSNIYQVNAPVYRTITQAVEDEIKQRKFIKLAQDTYSTVNTNQTVWGRATNINSNGTFNTDKLNGTVSDTQIDSATAWNNAKTLVSDITTDGTLTPFEKQTLKPEYDAILKEKIEAVTLATNYMVTGQSYYTNYIQAYDALYAGMNTIMTTGIASNSMITRSTMNGWFTNYYEKAAIFQRNINETARTIASGAATSAATANELAKAMTSGKSLYKDNVFAAGLNGLTVCNNSANSNVTVTRITNPADTPTTSTHAVEIKNIGTASPGIGGFIQPLTARANAKFVVRYIAKIPVGYTIATASNSMGTGYTDSFLTATAGTGKYEEYIRVVQCGSTGSFSNGGHVYLNGTAGSAGTPVVWYVARIDTYDVTDYEPFASHINADPNTVRISGSKLHFTDQVLMDNAWIDKLVANSIVTNKIQATDIAAGRITSGSISADRIAANSLSGDKIIANTIDATRLKIGSGAQGGYINNPRFTSWASTYPDGTSLWSAGGISKVTVDTVPMAQFAPAAGAQQGMTLDSSYFANGIDLDGMQYFALECRFRLTSGTNPAGASFLVDIYRQDNSYERMQLDMKEVGATVTANTWYVARKVFKLADANVAKTFKSIAGYLLANFSGAGDAAKTIQFASVNMFQASAQEFLAQSWTNGGTTSINGGFIATGTLSADKITTGALNASLITTGALNASLITTGNLDAARITAGVISAGNGKSTINMSTGAFNFGSGKIAYDGTTLLLNVDSLKITNSSVATEVYASLAAGTAKTEAISAAATDATSKVNGIEIGGRNTFKKTTAIAAIAGTNTTTKNSLNGMSIVSTVAGIARMSNVINENGFWTFSAWVTSTAPSTLAIDFCDMPTQNFEVSTTRTKITMTSNVTNYTSAIYHFIDIGGLIAATYTFEDVKVEKGNKATSWTPAPEDVAYDIEQKADSAEVAGNLNIVSTAAAQAKSIADAKLNKNTYDDFVKEYGEYKTSLAVDQSAAAGSLQAAQTAVASIKKEMGDMKESWMFNNGTKIEATPNGMLISDGNPSGMNMLLSQNRLSFFDGGVEVAYIADKTMKINNGIFVQSARIGSHLISTSPVNSDITIVSFVGEG